LKESSDGETFVAIGIWFQIWRAAEEKAQLPKSVLILGTCRRDCRGTERTTGLMVGYQIMMVSRLLSDEDLVG